MISSDTSFTESLAALIEEPVYFLGVTTWATQTVTSWIEQFVPNTQ